MLKQNNVNVLFLNLPHEDQIVRRYMCSYDSPESLLPPLELASLASVARSKGRKVFLLDAIAEKKTIDEVLDFIEVNKITSIVTITGFECYQEDVDLINHLKRECPNIQILVFGYYATQFPEETLRHSKCDIVILGEPDLIYSDLLIAKELDCVDGICYYDDNLKLRKGKSKRISQLKDLPMPAIDLFKDLYFEPLINRPYGMIQTMRGCPYKCNYCVKSFGSLTTSLSSDEIILQIKIWQQIHKVKTIRFIDDTFTLNRKRVIEICNKIIENNIKIDWMCLSRLDNLDLDLLKKMAESGCKRIYLGIESGSYKILERLNKKIDLESRIELLKTAKKLKIEFAGFFLGALPFETDEDFQKTIKFALDSKINFASYNPMTPYPGTEFYEEHKKDINFSIYPYNNEWKNKELYEIYLNRQKIFYKKFYFRLDFLNINRRLILKYITQVPSMLFRLVYSFINNRYFIIGGIKYKKE